MFTVNYYSDGEYPGLQAGLLGQDEHGGGDGDGEAEEAGEGGHQGGGREGIALRAAMVQ